MKKIILIMSITIGIYACSNNSAAKKEEPAAQNTEETGNPSYDPKRGVGK